MARKWRTASGSSGDSGGYTATWKPEAGDKLIGSVLGVRDVSTRYGEKQIANIEKEDGSGEVDVWLSATALANQWAELEPTIGDLVCIKYNGMSDGKAGQRYHDYELAVAEDEDVGRGNGKDAAPAGVAPMEEDDLPF